MCNTALFAWHAVATVWHQTLLPLIPTRAVHLGVCCRHAWPHEVPVQRQAHVTGRGADVPVQACVPQVDLPAGGAHPGHLAARRPGAGAGLPDVWLNAAHWRKWTDRRGGRPTRCLTERCSLVEMDRQERGQAYLMFDWTPLIPMSEGHHGQPKYSGWPVNSVLGVQSGR